MANQIFVIKPYWHDGTWVFDDESVGLLREPFVSGVPEILSDLVRDFPDARRGFRLTFSAEAFPDSQLTARRGEASAGGCWYSVGEEAGGEEGWLCPAMFRYFDEAPAKIHLSVSPIEPVDDSVRVSTSELDEIAESIKRGQHDTALRLLDAIRSPGRAANA